MLNYKNPAAGQKSSIDAGGNADQMHSFHWLRKAIIQTRREQFFMPLASSIGMPKHYGKTVKVYEYVPILDDRNNNDQGLDAAGAAYAKGNLYGSSKDVGTITSKLPALGESGGRVNRVGFTRIEREGSISQLGAFYEFTKDSMDFDSDEMLRDHLARELMNAATEITEDALQIDLLSAPGVVVYSGAAVSDAEITGEVTPEDAGAGTPEIPASVVTYEDIERLDQILTENRTPMQTTILTGSRFIDTAVVGACRIMFVGSELVPLLKRVKDPFGDKAFIEVQHYAAAGTPLNGEVGKIGNFRVIQVPEMLSWQGAGAEVDENPGYRTATVGGTERYSIFPMLVLGDDSWNAITFQTDGKTVNFEVMTKMPGMDTAHAATDPYGKTGFSSIQWWYGTLIKRPERIGLIKTVAPR